MTSNWHGSASSNRSVSCHCRIVVTWVVIFQRVGQLLWGLCITTTQRENSAEPLKVHSTPGRKACLRIQEFIVALLRKARRYLRHILLENPDRFFPIRLVIQPIDRLNVGTNEGDHQSFVFHRPRTPPRANVALIWSYHFRGFGELSEMLLSRK